MTSVQFYFSIPSSSCFTNWKKSFGCHPCQKNINPVSKQSNPILLHSFCFQCHCLRAISDPNDVAISSYQFNNYSIYASIIIAFIYHVFGHLIQIVVIRKYVPGLLTGILTSLFALLQSQNEFPIKLYSYSLFTLLVIILNLVVSFMILHKISHKK